jgi:hypothetical protein
VDNTRCVSDLHALKLARRGARSRPIQRGACNEYRATAFIVARKERIMSGRTRRWLIAVLTTVSTAVLVWLPTAAQAGLTATGID